MTKKPVFLTLSLWCSGVDYKVTVVEIGPRPRQEYKWYAVQRLPRGQIGCGPEQGAQPPAGGYENQQLCVLAEDKAD